MITSAQRSLLGELAVKAYRIRLYSTVPGIALEARQDALADLERSANVVNVVKGPPRPCLPRSKAPQTASHEKRPG
ncbi:MAG TPA: hypothetical protein VGR30_06185 [Candidatus Binatia bacterium]|nr:hypothetical protein [Candidatus Binatia bacterium]